MEAKRTVHINKKLRLDTYLYKFSILVTLLY